MLRAGIVGLPNIGKTTLFNAVTAQSSGLIANYAFSTSKPNVGVVAVPDERLAPLAKLVKTEVIVPASVEFVDIAGLVRGSSQGEGMGNQFLHAIRETVASAYKKPRRAATRLPARSWRSSTSYSRRWKSSSRRAASCLMTMGARSLEIIFC